MGTVENRIEGLPRTLNRRHTATLGRTKTAPQAQLSIFNNITCIPRPLLNNPPPRLRSCDTLVRWCGAAAAWRLRTSKGPESRPCPPFAVGYTTCSTRCISGPCIPMRHARSCARRRCRGASPACRRPCEGSEQVLVYIREGRSAAASERSCRPIPKRRSAVLLKLEHAWYGREEALEGTGTWPVGASPITPHLMI